MYHCNMSGTEYRADSAGGELHRYTRNPRDYLPDVRDGLTQDERTTSSPTVSILFTKTLPYLLVLT